MNLAPFILRGITTVHVRKWAAEAMVLPPVPPMPPVAPAPAEFTPWTNASPASLRARVASPVDILSGYTNPAAAGSVAAMNAEKLYPSVDVPAPAPVTPPAPVPPTTPAVAAAPTPQPSLAAQVPPGHTVDKPLDPKLVPQAKGQPATAANGTAARGKDWLDSAFDLGGKALHAAGEGIDKVTNDTLEKDLGTTLDGVEAIGNSPDTNWMNTAGDAFSDWRNWIAPVGMLLTLFGGKTTQLLGALMMGGGAVDLYQRYKGVEGMGQTPEGEQIIKQALTYKDANGQSQPFGNVAQLSAAYPEYAQRIKDLALSAKIGAKNMIKERVLQSGLAQAKTRGVMPERVISWLEQTQRITAEQRVEMLKKTQEAQQRLAAQTAPPAAAANG